MGQTYSIQSTQSPYPPIGATGLCEGCPVTVVDQVQSWTWVPRGDDLYTLSLGDSSGNWTVVPNQFKSAVALSQEDSQNWTVIFSDPENHSGAFHVSLPDNDLHWTITGTGEGTWVQLLPDGHDNPSWYQEFTRNPINN